MVLMPSHSAYLPPTSFYQGIESAGEAPKTAPPQYENYFEAVLADQAFSREQATTAYERSSAEARKQRDFQERMSDTAYLRAEKQLRQLGLNPYVLLSGFSGASTPNGASGNAYVGQSVSGSSAYSSIYGTKMKFASSLLQTIAGYLQNQSNNAMRAFQTMAYVML